VLIATLVDARPLPVAGAAICALLFVEQLTYLIKSGIGDALPALRAHYDPAALAEASWTLYVRTIGSANAAAFDLAKVPTLLGLGTVVTVAAVLAFRPTKTPAAAGIPSAAWQGADPSRRIATR